MGYLLVRAARPQQPAQVCLRRGEQAGADLPVGGQAGAVAVPAEGSGDGCDDPDAAARMLHSEGPAGCHVPLLRRGCAAFLRGAGSEVEMPAEHAQDLVGGDDVLGPPRTRRAERHALDETQSVAGKERLEEEVGRLAVVDPRHEHGVDLDGKQSRSRGGACAGDGVAVPVAAREHGVGSPVGRVHGDVDPVEPGRLEPGRAVDEPEPVRRERGLHGRAVPRRQP